MTVMHYTNQSAKDSSRDRVVCRTKNWASSTNYVPSVTCKRCLGLMGLSIKQKSISDIMEAPTKIAFAKAAQP